MVEVDELLVLDNYTLMFTYVLDMQNTRFVFRLLLRAKKDLRKTTSSVEISHSVISLG